MANIAFDLKTKESQVSGSAALGYLTAWSEHIKRTDRGEMTVTRDGENVKISVSNKQKKEEIDLKISSIKILHTYKRVEDWGEVLFTGYPEVGDWYEAKIEYNKLNVLNLTVSHVSEDGEKTWDKDFDYSKAPVESNNSTLNSA